MDNDISAAIDAAAKQDYVEFEKAIKQEIDRRVMADPYVKRRKEEYDRYQSIADTFKKIENL